MVLPDIPVTAMRPVRGRAHALSLAAAGKLLGEGPAEAGARDREVHSRVE